jgi:hypothetical protein
VQHKNNKKVWLFASVLLIAASSAIETPNHFSPEQDALMMSEISGRMLIWHEECARVMDDPSVVNRYAFESLQQYLEYCMERTSRDGNVPTKRPLLASNF